MRNHLKTLSLIAGLLAFSGAFAESGQSALQPVVSGTPHEVLLSIAFYGDVGIAVGAGGAILESGDAGKTWKAVQPAPTELSLLGISVQKGTALAVGQLGVILRMDADGKWQKVDGGTQSRLLAIKVNSHGTAIAVGAFGTVLKSDDGGEHWTSIAPASWTEYAEQEPHLYLVDIDEDGLITIGGEYGLLMRSSDGGGHWQLLHKGEASLFALQLRSDGPSYAVGQNGTVLRSADRGATWEEVKVDTTANLLGVAASTDGHVVVTGMHDMLLSDDNGGSWRHETNGEVVASWYAGATTLPSGSGIFVVGHSGQIVRVGG